MIEENIEAHTDIDLGDIGWFDCVIEGDVGSYNNERSWTVQLNSCIVMMKDCKTNKDYDIEVEEFLTTSARQVFEEHLIQVYKDKRDGY